MVGDARPARRRIGLVALHDPVAGKNVAVLVARRTLRGDPIEIGPARNESDAVGDLAILGSGGEIDVAVARAVDNGLRENRLHALLGHEHDTADLVALLDHVDAPGVEEHVDLLLFDHAVHEILGAFGVDRRLHEVLFCGLSAERRAEVLGAIHKLAADAARNDRKISAGFLAGRRKNDKNHTVREKTAERAVLLDKRNLRARLGGGDRRGETGTTATDNDDIGLMENRNLASGHHDLAALHERAGAVLGRMLNRIDPLSEARIQRIADRPGGQLLAGGDKFIAERSARNSGGSADTKTLEKLSLRNLHGKTPFEK